MTSATEELRRLLDERGVEWGANDTYRLLVTSWNDASGYSWVFMEYRDGSFSKLTAYHVTPEQAIIWTSAICAPNATGEKGKTMETKDPIERLREIAAKLDDAAARMSEHGFSLLAIKAKSIADEIEAEYVLREEHDQAWQLLKSKESRVRILENNLKQADGAREHWKAKAEAASYELANFKANVDAQYMKLPVDADGVLIRPGDRLAYGPETVVAAFVSDDYICTPNGTQVPSHTCRHVKPNTVERLLEEFQDNTLSAQCEYAGEVIEFDCFRQELCTLIEEYAERIRKAVNHGADE